VLQLSDLAVEVTRHRSNTLPVISTWHLTTNVTRE
jgi:hypothetical protein